MLLTNFENGKELRIATILVIWNELIFLHITCEGKKEPLI
jgi:hypothetical protein